MIQSLSKILSAIVLVVIIIVSPSCNDKWDNHYKDEQTGIAHGTIMEYIRSQSELSIFDTMLVISGYDSIISRSQSFTVWAPNNEALAGVDLSNKTLVKDIVENHISRKLVTTSEIINGARYIPVINGKNAYFSYDGANYSFAGKLLTVGNVLTINGIVHTVNGYLPYQPNIYEYIKRTPGFTSYYNYIKMFWDSTYVPGNKYDTTYVYTNYYFRSRGYLNKEFIDTSYTAILPTDTAWKNAYNKIKNYYVSAHKTMATAIQDVYTQMTIADNLIFNNRVYNPFSLDSLVSTSKNVFKNPGYLFTNSSLQELSNGLGYVTDSFKFKPTQTWFKPIRVEAEYSSGRLPNNALIFNRYSYGSKLPVSNSRYIYVEPTTTSTLSRVYVEFTIPYNLSAKYNIYCIFIPVNMEDSTDKRPNKVKAYISYLNASKTYLKQQQLTLTRSITNTTDTTKLLLASKFKFPFSHVSANELPEQVAKIVIQTDVKAGTTGSGEEKTYCRSMRIDCILLEPVEE